MRAKEKRGSLLGVLDHTKTPMGARFMRRSVELPLVNSFALNRRLDAVGELKDDMMLREECFVRLSNVRDIEETSDKARLTGTPTRATCWRSETLSR